MKVLWTTGARTRLREIEAFIAKDSPKAARDMTTRLIRRAMQLEHPPLLGKRLPRYASADIRELLARTPVSADLSGDRNANRNRDVDALPPADAERPGRRAEKILIGWTPYGDVRATTAAPSSTWRASTASRGSRLRVGNRPCNKLTSSLKHVSPSRGTTSNEHA